MPVKHANNPPGGILVDERGQYFFHWQVRLTVCDLTVDEIRNQLLSVCTIYS